MDRRKLITTLRNLAQAAGVDFQSDGGTKHEKFRINGRMILVPRHRQIKVGTALAIIQQTKQAIEKGHSNND